MKLEVINSLQCDFSLSSQQALLVSGPNGSGKTTLLRMLCGLRELSPGDILFNGKSVTNNWQSFLHNCLYIGHQNAIKSQLTVAENLQMQPGFAASISDKDPYHYFNLTALRDKKCEMLSQGQKRKVALAKMMLNKAAIWLLDEPFTALDDDSCQKTANLMAQHVQQGGMLIYTSHQKVTLPNVTQQRLTLAMRES